MKKILFAILAVFSVVLFTSFIVTAEEIRGADKDRDGFDVIDDCDDNDPNVNPDAIEVCRDGIDNDCNEETTDEKNCQDCTDYDIDGFFVEEECKGKVDCDDTDYAINPDEKEICGDGIDNDCDGATDSDDSDCPSS